MLRILLVVFALTGLGGFITIVWVMDHGSLASPAHATPPPPARAQVLTAAKELRAGALLQSTDIASRDMAETEIPPSAQRDGPDERRALIGSMIRRNVQATTVLQSEDLLHPGERGFLAAVLQPGMLAVTVAVDSVSGSAGLIWPGDRVDVVLTQAIEDPSLPLSRRVAAEAMLHNARVIAIDQALMQGAAAAGKDQPGGHTVTLEVSGREAERVAVAARIGRLSLMVRAADAVSDGGRTLVSVERDATEREPVWAGDVSHALRTPEKAPATGIIQLWRGNGERKEFRF
jgi:pilus assembly protein CpaB